MSDNEGNNRRKLLPENLEDLDRDPPDGPAGIALFLSHCDQQVSHNEERKNKEQTFLNINYLDFFYSMAEDEELLDCFLDLPNMEKAEKNLLTFEWIEEGQLQDLQLHYRKHQHPTQFITR